MENSAKSEKPKRVLLETGPGLTIERLIEFGRKLIGRDPTPEEIEEMRREWPELPEK